MVYIEMEVLPVRLSSSRISRKIIGVVIIAMMGVTGIINPVTAQQRQFFSKDEVICREVIDSGFTSTVNASGNTVRIIYKSLKGLPDDNNDNSPRPSVLGNKSIIISRNFFVELTYLDEEKSQEYSRNYYQKTDPVDLLGIKNQEIILENVSTDSKKSVIVSSVSSGIETYRFRRDIIYQDHAGVIKIQSSGLDSRCINMPITGFLDILERHALSVIANQGVSQAEAIVGPNSDNIDLATKDLNLAVAFLNKKKAEGASDRQIADLVNRIVSQRVQVLNRIMPESWKDWSNPAAFFLNYVFGHFEDSFGKWRSFSCLDYDTNAIWTWNNKIGQCEDTATLSYYLLKNAGVNCSIYAVSGHAFVIINTNQAGISDSRSWEDNILVVDPWQNKVLDKQEAYRNKYIFNRGKNLATNVTNSFQPAKGYADIKSRNIVWDVEAKIWKPRDGYKFKYLSGAWMGYCIPKE